VHPAVGYTVNMEMPPEYGNRKYELVFDGIIQKILMQFGPDLVIIECGFDVYYGTVPKSSYSSESIKRRYDYKSV